MSTPAPIFSLNRLLADALRSADPANVDLILSDYSTVRAILDKPEPKINSTPQIDRFYLTPESDPDYPGILDRARPDMVASWREPRFLENAKEHLGYSEEDILDLMWEERQ